MTRIIRGLITALVCICVSSIFVEAIGIGYLWMNGGLEPDRLFRAIAAIHDVDLYAIQAEIENVGKPKDIEQVSFDAKLDWRIAESLDLDRREAAINIALSELRQLQLTLKIDQERYQTIKESFDKELKELESRFAKDGILNLGKTLASLQPKQAKEQILKIIDDEPVETYTQAMNDVVAIIKTMPLDKQKKILGEFKTENESDTLREILRQIRLGEPEVSVTRDAQNQLNRN